MHRRVVYSGAIIFHTFISRAMKAFGRWCLFCTQRTSTDSHAGRALRGLAQRPATHHGAHCHIQLAELLVELVREAPDLGSEDGRDAKPMHSRWPPRPSRNWRYRSCDGVGVVNGGGNIIHYRGTCTSSIVVSEGRRGGRRCWGA